MVLVWDGSKGNNQLLSVCWVFLKSNDKNYLTYSFSLIFLSASSGLFCGMQRKYSHA